MHLTCLGDYVANLPLSEFTDSPRLSFSNSKSFKKISSIEYNEIIREYKFPDFSKKNDFSLKANHESYLPKERVFYGHRLLDGQQNISDFVLGGICHDATAYTRYLLGSELSAEQIKNTFPNRWIEKFQFSLGSQWDGESSLPGGKAIGFYTQANGNTPHSPTDLKEIFHSAIAVGGTEIRAVNGLDLGASWMHPVDLKSVLNVRNIDGTFDYDRRKIRVFISSV